MRRKRLKKGASLGCDGKSLRNLQTVSINRKSTHGKNNQKRSTLHSATVLMFKQTHGVSLPKTLTGTPYRCPRRRSLPKKRFSNLCGVAHPFDGGVSFTIDNLNQGESHE